MKCTDQNIIELINKHQESAEREAINCMQGCRPQAISVLGRQGLKEMDERVSFYNLSVVNFIIKVRKKEFQLTGQAKICTYITETAKRKWLAFRKKHNKPLPKGPDVVDPENGLSEEVKARLRRALDKLSATDRDIVTAFYFYETPLDEYAESRKISYDSAKKRLSRARARLKEIYKTIQ